MEPFGQRMAMVQFQYYSNYLFIQTISCGSENVTSGHELLDEGGNLLEQGDFIAAYLRYRI